MHQLKTVRQRWQAGDTIVEVMIVLAVLGLAISISYATANRSLLNARQAQENSIATELAQSQIEAIQAVGCTTASPDCDPTANPDPSNPPVSYQLFHQTGAFCMNTTVSPPAIVPTASVTHDSNCNNIDNLYKIRDKYSGTIFTVKVSWNDVLGQGLDTVTMTYSLPEGN